MPKSRAHSRRFIHPNGVWSTIASLLLEFPAGSSIRWLTYSFNPSPQMIAAVKGWDVRVVARFPDGNPSIAPATWHRWYKAFPKTPPNLFGMGEPRDGTEDIVGPLHAKALAARSPDGSKVIGLIGSFNLEGSSLHRNAETMVVLDPAEARELWNELDELDDDHPEIHPILWTDCRGSEPELAALPAIASPAAVFADPPAARPARTLPEPAQEILALQAPPPIDLLAATLKEMLAEYPHPGHPKSGIQLRVYKDMQARAKKLPASAADVLFLPVGVGKTYLAMMWALDALAKARVEKKSRRYGVIVYLVHNAWIQASVLEAMRRLASRASNGKAKQEASLLEALTGLILVRRPSEIRSIYKSASRHLAGVVADECHKWNPHAATDIKPSDRKRWHYTHALNSLRSDQAVPVLGLSATPCRFEAGRFNIADFVQQFCGTKRTWQAEPPFKLGFAIESGLLARPEFVPILAGSLSAVRASLQSNGALASYGDYSAVTLREVWGILDAKRTELIAEIVEHIRGRKARRVLVFIPPVGELADAFVLEFHAALRETFGRPHFIDFRTSAIDAGAPEDRFRSFGTPAARPAQPAVLVTIDRFSEGVSVTDIDMLVQLRATLSPKIAVQSLGRGLRLDPAKHDACVVLDAVDFRRLIQEWDDTVPELTSTAR